MENEKNSETFESFIKSFFYGKRSDLSFKFLSDLTPEDAAGFLQKLFKEIVNSIDLNDLSPLKKQLLQGQIQGYFDQKNFEYNDGPFQPLKKPLSELKLSLITSSGHFLKNKDPNPLGVEKMSQDEAEKRVFDFLKEEPYLSQIPFNTPQDELRVRHGGYDIRAAQHDPNVSFPYQRIKEISKTDLFSNLTENAYSFVGACSQKRLLKKTLPVWVDKFLGLGINAVILVPV